MNDYRIISQETVIGENGSVPFVSLPWSIVGTTQKGIAPA
jgi:hypothetical protein